MTKKRRKRKKPIIKYIGRGLFVFFKYLFKGIYYTSKYLYFGIKYLINKIKSKDQDKKIKKGKLKIKPKEINFKELKTLTGSFKDFQNKILNSKSTIGIILGARGTGKSAIGMRLLETFKAKTNKKIYALGFNPEDLPRWINVVKSVDEVENGSVLLADESGIEFSSRDSMSERNKFLSQLLFIARHKDLSIMFISQNSSNIEINTLRQADYLILKPSSLLQKDFERRKIKEIYEQVENYFDEFKQDKGLTYVYSNEYRGFISSPLPGFWSEKVSKAYSKK